MMEALSRRFRFGITGRGETLKEWTDFARKAEDLGYSTLVVGDHVDRFFAPLLGLVAAAQATTKLRLGAQVLVNDLRHPAIVAKEAATADVLTNGRFELGIGAGSTPRDRHLIGLPDEAAGLRLERVAESVGILKAFFTQDPLTFHGKHYEIEELPTYPKPVQHPHPPLAIGASGPRMLSLAAREADIVSILTQQSAGSRATGGMEAKVALVRSAAGARYSQCELHTWYTSIQVDGQPAQGPSGGAILGLLGSREQIIERLVADREQNDISYITVTGPAIDAFAPVVARLAGS